MNQVQSSSMTSPGSKRRDKGQMEASQIIGVRCISRGPGCRQELLQFYWGRDDGPGAEVKWDPRQGWVRVPGEAVNALKAVTRCYDFSTTSRSFKWYWYGCNSVRMCHVLFFQTHWAWFPYWYSFLGAYDSASLILLSIITVIIIPLNIL